MAYAASVNVQSVLLANVVANAVDDNICLATGTPLTILCNRQYRVVDFSFLTNVVSAEASGSVELESCLAANSPSGVDTTQLGTVDASAGTSATDYKRATTVTLTSGATNGLAQLAFVPRGRFFRIRSLAAGGDLGANIRCSGTVSILPGNRYAAGTGSYYPNNSVALQS